MARKPRPATRGAGYATLKEKLMNHEPFKTGGSLSASDYKHGTGNLPEPHRERFIHDTGIVYVVYSYLTPIAWVRRGGAVYIPAVKYSSTTSKHQGCLYWLNHE